MSLALAQALSGSPGAPRAVRHGRTSRVEPWTLSVVEVGDGLELSVVTLPHPSGLNRVWNDNMWGAGGLVERARGVLRAAAPHVSWGRTGERFGP